ncbi:hypothetical protein C1T17_18290 [Sphingobium sp. SCG-1]|uniref:hypothetical protein n=1 Tax=Sphingobium sp. SCG-1 TaxID=2072936 RepID=UPI000CD691D9|nr:hypothetical protein [Sphingobium sp. SCG-1]AUW59736.1 hypothetical protein C1T17_18290 [Sphingobium sp. SCG-1]
MDSGIRLDPRFATGVLLFRTQSVMTQDEANKFHALTTSGASVGLDAAPPSAILVGPESKSTPAAPDGLDSSLILWAKRHGYPDVTLPATNAQLYLRPSKRAGRLIYTEL